MWYPVLFGDKGTWLTDTPFTMVVYAIMGMAGIALLWNPVLRFCEGLGRFEEELEEDMNDEVAIDAAWSNHPNNPPLTMDDVRKWISSTDAALLPSSGHGRSAHQLLQLQKVITDRLDFLQEEMNTDRIILRKLIDRLDDSIFDETCDGDSRDMWTWVVHHICQLSTVEAENEQRRQNFNEKRKLLQELKALGVNMKEVDERS